MAEYAARYWVAATYQARHSKGQEPQNIDKEFLRLWFRSNCDPYKDEVPHEATGLDTARPQLCMGLMPWKPACLPPQSFQAQQPTGKDINLRSPSTCIPAKLQMGLHSSVADLPTALKRPSTAHASGQHNTQDS